MSAAPEVTRYFPRPGRTPPARLQLVTANPFEEEDRTTCQPALTWEDILRMRGELPAPTTPPRPKASKQPKAFVPPYLKPGYRWDLLGQDLHDHLWREMGKPAAIRPCPPSLAKLLSTPEWKGSSVGPLAQHEVDRLRSQLVGHLHAAEVEYREATAKRPKAIAQSVVDARQARLERLPSAVKLTHPSGATLVWME